MFAAQLYHHRRESLAAALSGGLALLPANGDAPMNYRDNIYPFRQDSNFRYFTGLNHPDLVLVVDGATGESTLYGDDIDINYIVWMGTQPTVAERAALAGIEHTGTTRELRQLLSKTSAKIHFLPPYRAERREQLQAWLGDREDFKVASARLSSKADPFSAMASTTLIDAVITQRSIKSAEEIVEMEIAVNTTRKMHHLAMDIATPGMTEAEVAGAIEGVAIAGGGRLSYPAIVTRNGHILHNHYHGNTLQKGDLLLIDAGAESSSGYAGDITRTFSVGAEMTDQQRFIYDLVKKAEEDVIADLKPGVPYRDYHNQSATIIATGLKDAGLMKGDPAEAVAAGAHALFFPHGLGHMIGLDVHDMEDLGEDRVGYDDEFRRSELFGTRSLRLGRRLEAGFVLTVEPGIYFIPTLIDLWKSEGRYLDFINYDALDPYRDFGGIRIEDNVLITEDGARVLGDPIRK